MNFGKYPSFGSGLKKVFKRNPVTKSILKIPPNLYGSLYLFGRIRSGKTAAMLSLSGIYHDNPDRRYKIFDMWGGDRSENLYWGLPSNKIKYWNYAKKIMKLKEPGPKQYKVEYLYPLFPKLRKKLPFNPPNVTSRLITFNLKDLKPEDFPFVIGDISNRSVSVWNKVISESKRTDSAFRIIEKFKEESSTSNSVYNSILYPLVKNLFLQDDNSVFNLGRKEISRILNDRETVTVLSLDYVPEEFKLFVVRVILRMINEELNRRSRQVIVNIREASDFFKINELSVVPDRYKVMKSYISDSIKLGRKGIHFFLDVQSVHDTRGLVSGQQDITLFGRLPSEADRKDATDQLFRDGLIYKKQIAFLGASDPGQFILCPSGRKCREVYIMLPRCRYWEERNGNFYTNIWEKEVGRWIDFNDERIKLEERYKEEKKEYELEKAAKIKSKKKIRKGIPNVVKILKEPEEVEEEKQKPKDINMYDLINTNIGDI